MYAIVLGVSATAPLAVIIALGHQAYLAARSWLYRRAGEDLHRRRL